MSHRPTSPPIRGVAPSSGGVGARKSQDAGPNRKAVEQPPKITYSQVAALPPAEPAKRSRLPQCGSAHTLIITSEEKADTADHVMEKVRTAVDARRMGDIVESIKTHNKHATAGLDWGGITIRVKFRRRAKNDLECYPVLEFSPELWCRLVDAKYVYVGLQRHPVRDQSPLVQCTQCLGFGHIRKYCTGTAEKCAHCGGEHRFQVAKSAKMASPQNASTAQITS
ncbi:hypothetical protein EVAR_77938_1 [Eumeta japonica]|uniref:Nucleic-acid-binding protein from transposon X-element n=1 Tax=Eumeta variegata TaxID=151549 RepID=A0A4C1XR32_EUMVA|nr:hypothetical protein EVAR_77938_1 [Eumeta japonica]